MLTKLNVVARIKSKRSISKVRECESLNPKDSILNCRVLLSFS